MNISNGTNNSFSENWNSNNPSMVSFLGIESNNQQQFWGWDPNTNPNNGYPFISNPTNNLFDCSNLSSSSTNFTSDYFPYTQFPNYPPADYLKREEAYFDSARIGLNLGHRTYFSSRDSAIIDRLFRRPRGFYQTNQVPRCQAEGCRMDLTNAKHYHRRHKVCEYHSKASKVVANGIEQRFCQQCSRFHILSEFDDAKRSCRKRLADHNRRRRKPQNGSADSLPAISQAESSSSRSEVKEKSLSSSTIPLMASKSITTTGLSLGGEHQIPYNTTATIPERLFFYNNESTQLFERENNLSPYHNLFFSNSNEASQSTGCVSDQSQNPEDLQNILHLGQAMFEAEF